jgi:hypothetical protein
VNLRLLTIPAAAAIVAATLLSACAAGGTRTVYELATAPASSPPETAPAPSPVSTQALVSGHCTMGLLDETTHVFDPMTTVGGGQGMPQGDTAAEAYQMTLTNAGATAAEVTGFSAVFYTGGTTETTSDTETFDSPTFLEPDQSLTWTEAPWGSYTVAQGSPATGPFTTGETGATDASATCQLVQWTHP